MIWRSHTCLSHITVVLALAVGLMSACSAPGSSQPAPATTNGEELFSLRAIGASAGCVTCHSLAPDHVLVGPSLAGVADRADSTVPGMGADEYLRAAIVSPTDHVIEPFDANKMPSTYGELLSERQIDALVGYLKEAT